MVKKLAVFLSLLELICDYSLRPDGMFHDSSEVKFEGKSPPPPPAGEDQEEAKKDRTPATPVTLDEVRSWWEVASIVHFSSVFRPAFELPEFEFDVSEAVLMSKFFFCDKSNVAKIISAIAVFQRLKLFRTVLMAAYYTKSLGKFNVYFSKNSNVRF